VQAYAQKRNLPERTIFGLALALEECGSNIVNHAFHGDAEKTFQVAFGESEGVFFVELRDRGPVFDPTSIADRELLAREDDVPGGWGVHLVRNFMDDIHYTREGIENVLLLTKRLQPVTDKT
jgi:sigma-B regulation protein RsbU (phosphoserine phosphatase)